MSESVTYNMDCMEYLKSVPDKYFDLAVVDPPYGDASLPDDVEAPDTHTQRDGRDTDRGRTSDNRTEHGAMRSGDRTRQIDHLHSSCRQRERERSGGTDSVRDSTDTNTTASPLPRWRPMEQVPRQTDSARIGGGVLNDQSNAQAEHGLKSTGKKS